MKTGDREVGGYKIKTAELEVGRYKIKTGDSEVGCYKIKTADSEVGRYKMKTGGRDGGRYKSIAIALLCPSDSVVFDLIIVRCRAHPFGTFELRFLVIDLPASTILAGRIAKKRLIGW
jgi:hypothetical protein